MTKYLYPIILLGFMTACNSGSEEMEAALFAPENEMMEEQAVTVVNGEFSSDTHATSGTVTVSDDKMFLRLNNFKTDNGPKLNLYLSTEVNSQEYIDLGDLKGVEGDFDYDIPENTDLETYKYVVVWCVDFSVSFGHAELSFE